ncbi:hypothetical protein Tco_1058092 [Tanacetum coccineum]|uniref:Uncharacterized protein n=1 Tax=Tanacetum coccineum TaxID=301880 RepID=A0ABQ5H775_9ASTR
MASTCSWSRDVTIADGISNQWLMASMGSSPCLNTKTVRPNSGWGNSGVLLGDKVIHYMVTDIVKLVVEIESFGMSSDEFDKETRSFDGLQPKQADLRSGYQQKGRKPSQNDKTEHGMEKTVQNQGQSPKMPKSESILKNQQPNGLLTQLQQPIGVHMKTVKTKWALNQFQQPICVQLTKTVKTLKAQS